jgi:hypothetical protein
MEISLHISNNEYTERTIYAWQEVWENICKMAYEKMEPIEKIITNPGALIVNGKMVSKNSEVGHCHYYASKTPVNDYLITLDYTWKIYSKKYGSTMPGVVPEFKELYVPRPIFDDMGIQKWFSHSFPNCKIFYWSE